MPTWTVSPGTDKDGRELAILDAVEKGRISVDYARKVLPYHRDDEALSARLLALELSRDITNLTTQISDTQGKLARSEGNRVSLEQELKRRGGAVSLVRIASSHATRAMARPVTFHNWEGRRPARWRMSRFSRTSVWPSPVPRTATSTIVRARSSARITWLGNNTRNAG